MPRKTANPPPTPENPAVADETAPAPVPDSAPEAPAPGLDAPAPVPEGAREAMESLDRGMEVAATSHQGVPALMPGLEALALEPSAEFPDAPQPEQPPTWAELAAMAEMMERFSQRLLQVENRAAKMAEILRNNYGVRL